jgi:hypothetical protein
MVERATGFGKLVMLDFSGTSSGAGQVAVDGEWGEGKAPDIEDGGGEDGGEEEEVVESIRWR